MKSSMSRQPIGIINRFASSWNILHRYRQGIFGSAELEINYYKRLFDIIRSHVTIEINNARILELGCGQMATQTALLASNGADVTGIDVEIPTYRMNLQIFLETLKKNGFERAIKSLFRHVLFDRAYIKKISLLHDKKIPYSELDIQIMDAADLRFPNNHFDFVFSRDVFEHIDDVPNAVKGVNRVLKKSGIAWIRAHLFPSLSGGHHLAWMFADKSPSDKVPPWDHLLANTYPVNTYLNKLRLDQYRKIFHDNISVLKERTKEEGHNILTPKLLELLSAKGYTKEDLLTSSVLFLCRKK